MENDLELDLLDINLDGIEIEDAGDMSFVYNTAGRKEVVLDALKKVQTSCLELLSLEQAVRTALDKSNTAKQNLIQLHLNKSTKTVDNGFKECKAQLNGVLTRLAEDIQACEEMSKVGLVQYGRFTLDDAMYVANSIPEVLGRADYLHLLSTIEASSKPQEPLSLNNRKKIYRKLYTIMYNCDETKSCVNNNVNNFNINTDKPLFDVSARFDSVNKTIELLSNAEAISEYPDVYFIKQIEEVQVTGMNKLNYKITCDLFYSESAAPAETKQLYRPITFNNQMHLLGVSNMNVGNNYTLSGLVTEFLPLIVEDYKINLSTDYQYDGIIRYPYYMYGKYEDSDKYYVVLAEPDSVYTTDKLELGETLNEEFGTNLAFLQEAINRKSNQNPKTPVWYTTITASSESLPSAIIKVEVVKESHKQLGRFTGDELLSIAKTRNIKHILTQYYPVKAGKLIPPADWSPAQITLASSCVERDTLLLKTAKKITNLSCVFNNVLTPNRSILLHTLINIIDRPVTTRAGIEKIFYENTDKIVKQGVKLMFSKIQFDMISISTTLNNLVQEDNFYEFIKSEKYKEESDCKFNLRSIDIIDNIAFIIRLRLEGYLSQSFRDDKILKNIIGENGSLQTIELTHDDFVKDIVRIHKEPRSLLYLWGIVPEMGDSVTRTSSALTSILVYLIEAYNVYNILLNNKNFVIAEEKELIAEGVKSMSKQLLTNKASAPEDYNTYNTIKDLSISKEYYESYCKYLTHVINNCTTKEMTFDANMFINCYIRAISSLSTANRTLIQKLYIPKREVYNGDNPLVEELLNKQQDIDVNLDEACVILNFNLKLSTEDKERLSRLYEDVSGCVGLTVIPIYELYNTLNALTCNGTLASFTEEDRVSFLDRLGLNTINEPQGNFYDVEITNEEYLPNSLRKGADTYIIRDKKIIESCINSMGMRKWIKETSVPTCDWAKAHTNLYNLIAKKFKVYLNPENILNKVIQKLPNLNTERLAYYIRSYINILAPTEIDASILLTNINNKISDTAINNKSTINLSKLNLTTATMSEIVSLEEELALATYENDCAMILAPFLPIDVVIQTSEKLNTINENLANIVDGNINLALNDVKLVKKSTALYTKYLKTGNHDYLIGLDLNLIPFSLLVLDEPVRYAVAGHYSKINLINDFDLSDARTPESIAEAMELSYMELFDQILETYPEFLFDAPKGIRDYILTNKAR